MGKTLRDTLLQDMLENGWTRESLQQDLPDVQRHFLPTAPEFVGVFGKDYLEAILTRVLPARLYGTWRTLLNGLALAEYRQELFDLSAYVEALGTRGATLERNIATLQARGLAAVQMDRRGIKHQIDFTGLYFLASEYHQWDQSEDYIAPEKELVKLIKKDPLLVAKLRRFDVYRKVLYQGAKFKEAEITSWYASEREVPHD